MSTRYEWMYLPAVSYVGPGCDVTTGEPVDIEDGWVSDHVVSRWDGGALVLTADEATVVTGSPEELREWAAGILQLLEERT